MKDVPFSVYLLYGFEICVTWQCKSSWKTNPLFNLTAQRYPPPPWRIFLVHFESQCALAILRIERLLDPKGTISIWGWEPCCRVVVALHLQQGHAMSVSTVHVVLCPVLCPACVRDHRTGNCRPWRLLGVLLGTPLFYLHSRMMKMIFLFPHLIGRPGLHKLCDVLISWAHRGSCAHKCVC